MRILYPLFIVFMIAIAVSCDLRSGIAKQNMEKYVSTPTPPISPTPTPEAVDPADIVSVDTSVQGDMISINGYELNQTKDCTKFNRLMINGDDNVVTIKGVCRQIMINGDRNKVTADAATEFVLNGSENIVRYSRFPNGNRPTVIENRPGNVIEKAAAEAMTTNQKQYKIVK